MADSSPLSSLNAQLLNHGWAKRPLNLDALDNRSRVDVVTTMFEMLGAHVNNIDLFDELSARHRTLQYEHERLAKANRQATTVQGRLEAELQGVKSKCAEAEKRLQAEEAKNKEWREEISRGRKALEGVRTAATQEVRKVELRLEAAQAKLAKFSNDASLITRPQGMYLVNPIPSNRSAPVVTGQAPLLEQSLRDLAQVRQGLEDESEAFRSVLVSTANTLRETLAYADGKDAPARMGSGQFFTSPPSRSLRGPRGGMGGPSSSSATYTHVSPPSTSHASIADTRLKALVSDLRNRISDRIVHVHAGSAPIETAEEEEARRRAEREIEKRRMDLEDRVKDLEVEIGVARGREEEAKKAMEEFVRRQQEESAKPGDDSALREQEEIWKQKMALADQKRVFRAQMERLEQERRRFEVERQKFMDDRRRIDVDDIVNMLPTTPSSSSSISQSSGSSSSVSMSASSISADTIDAGSEISHEATLASSSCSSTLPEAKPPATVTVMASPVRLTQPMAHMPHSPSPLSPAHGGKPRTPKSHLAMRRKNKTPLSRLVLEKAVRQKARDHTATAQNQPAILGESTRRANAPQSAPGLAGQLSRSLSDAKGKSKATGPGTAMPGALRASAKPASRRLDASTAPAQAAKPPTLQSSVNRPGVLGKSIASGAAAQGKTAKVWR